MTEFCNKEDKLYFLIAKKKDLKATKTLLEEGVDLEAVCKQFNISLLCEAIQGSSSIKNKIKMIQLLLEYGADVNQKNEYGQTPLMMASFLNSKKIFSTLIKYGAINSIGEKDTNNGSTVLHIACEKQWDNFQFIKFLCDYIDDVNLINEKDNEGFTPLILASFLQKKETVKLLLEKGGLVNEKNNDGETALMRACEKEEANVKLLLENGAISTINEKDIKGNFALLYASFLGNFRIVKLLLENGAISTINEKNIDGETALFKAAKNGYTKTVKLLLENGALVNEKNNNGETAINSATKSMKFVSFTKKSLFKQTIELLLEYEAAAQCK